MTVQAPEPDPDALYVLRTLVQQLQGSGYRDRFGHPVENLEAFLDAVALLELLGTKP